MMKTHKMKSCDLSHHCFLTMLFPLAEMSAVSKKEPTSSYHTLIDASKLSSYQLSLEMFKVKEILKFNFQLLDYKFICITSLQFGHRNKKIKEFFSFFSEKHKTKKVKVHWIFPLEFHRQKQLPKIEKA